MNRWFANEEIIGYNVIVVDETGSNKGEISKRLAISLAKEKGYDLVQVGKNSNGLPICKFADVGKLRFEASKKKNHSKPVETKEMTFHLNTGINDINIKKNKIRSMLDKKCIVKFGIQLKGREMVFLNNAKELLLQSVADLREVAEWDDLKALGNLVFVVLRPKKKVDSNERSSLDKSE
jgi:translation initiation factor IF-3